MPPVAAAAAAVVGAISAATAAVGTAVASALVAGGLTVGAALTVTSLGGTLLTTLLTTTALSLVGGVLSGKPDLGASTGSQADWMADPSAGVPYAIGETGYAGSIVYRKSSGAKLKYDTFVTVHSAAGPIESETAYYANSVPLGFSADSGEGQDGFYKNRMWRKASLGATPAAHLTLTATGSKDTPADHGGIPADWDAACKLSGLAADMLVLEYDTAIYAGGPPKPLRKFKAVKCYDPRKDSTYPGGSGPHRWADPSNTSAHDAARLTWEWTENPQLHALHWTLGRWERDPTNPASTYTRILGVGAPIAAVDVPAFVEGANVSTAHGWKVSGVVYSTGDKFDILASMLQAGSARPVSVGAKISCLTNAPRVSLDTITGDDLIGEAQVAAAQPRRDRINAIWPRYLEEGAGWQIVPTRVPVTVTAYEGADGGRKTKEVEYTLVPSADQVATLARYDIENTREIGPITLPLRPYWHGYKGGDCLTVHEPELGLLNQKVLLLDRKIDMASLSVTVTLRSETDAKHPFALGETADPPPLPALTTDEHLRSAPGGDTFSASATFEAGPDGSLPVIVIEGEADSAFALGIIIDSRQVFDDGTYGAWISEEFPLSADHTYRLKGLAPGGEYQLHVRYRTAAGVSDFDTHADLGVVQIGGLTATNALFLGNVAAQQILAAIASATGATDAAVAAALRKFGTAGEDLNAQSIVEIARRLADVSKQVAKLAPAGLPLGPFLAQVQDSTETSAETLDIIGVRTEDQTGFVFNGTRVEVEPGLTLTEYRQVLQAGFDDVSSTVATNYNAQSTAILANASAVTALQSTVGNVSATAAQNYSTLASATSAEAQERLALAAVVGGVSSTVNQNYIALAAADSTEALARQSLESTFNGFNASASSQLVTLSSTTQSIAASITALSASGGGLSSTVTAQGAALADLQNKLAVASYEIITAASGSNPAYLKLTSGYYGSNIALVGDRLLLGNPNGNGSDVQAALLAIGGNIVIPNMLLVGPSGQVQLGGSQPTFRAYYGNGVLAVRVGVW